MPSLFLHSVSLSELFPSSSAKVFDNHDKESVSYGDQDLIRLLFKSKIGRLARYS